MQKEAEFAKSAAEKTAEVKVMNATILDNLAGSDAAVEKVAAASGAFTRTQIREDSFAHQILPCEPASDSDLVPSLTHDKPMIYEELEPDSPGAKWVPFQTVPDGEYIYGSRYVVPLARIVTKKYEKDLAELRVYKTDLRKHLTDNSIKDGLAEIDGKFIQLCDEIVEDQVAYNVTTGTIDNSWSYGDVLPANHVAVQAQTGKVQDMTFGDLNKSNFVDAKTMMIEGSLYKGMGRKYHLRSHICLMNDVTAQQWQKLNASEISHEITGKMFKGGLYLDTILGMNFVFTLKTDLVPNGMAYFFAAPEFLGKSYYLEDWTMYMKKEAFNIEMFSYWLGGMAIGNVAGVCRAKFTI